MEAKLRELYPKFFQQANGGDDSQRDSAASSTDTGAGDGGSDAGSDSDRANTTRVRYAEEGGRDAETKGGEFTFKFQPGRKKKRARPTKPRK